MELSSRIACHVCGKYFYTDMSLKMHIMRVHGTRKIAQDREQHVDTVAKKGSICSVCNRCFPTDRALIQHAVRVHGTAESDAVVTVHDAVESDTETAHAPVSYTHLTLPTKRIV